MGNKGVSRGGDVGCGLVVCDNDDRWFRRRVGMTSALPDKEEREMMLHRSCEEAERV